MAYKREGVYMYNDRKYYVHRCTVIYIYDSNCSKQFWQVNFMNVVTLCFHNIFKELKHKKTNINVRQEGKRHVSTVLLWQLNSHPELQSNPLTQNGDIVFLFPKHFFLIESWVNHACLKILLLVGIFSLITNLVNPLNHVSVWSWLCNNYI